MKTTRVLPLFTQSVNNLKIHSVIPTPLEGSSVSTVLFGTHDGNFHCDEALALSLLTMHPTYQNRFEIVRTRDQE
jgi:hypothetical protein